MPRSVPEHALVRPVAVAILSEAGWSREQIALVLPTGPRRKCGGGVPRWLLYLRAKAVAVLIGPMGQAAAAVAMRVCRDSITNYRRIDTTVPVPPPRAKRRRTIYPSDLRLCEMIDIEGIGIPVLAAHYGVARYTLVRRLRRARARVGIA